MNHAKDREYQFDALGRLRFAKGGVNGGLSTQEYQFDRFGNRTSVSVSGAAADNSPMPRDGIASLSYETASNRITTTGWAYDSAGNQTKAFAEDGVTLLKFEYDAANRMVAVRKDADNSLWETQEFGVGNDRISQTNYANNQTKYYYGSIEYTETNNNGSLIWSKSYVYLGDAILSTISNNGANGETVEYNHPDRLGTKVVTNQQAGTSIEQNALPFGTALNAESSGATAKRFTSYERSNRTGLDYAQNRTYDSKQGRFTQVDPIGIGGSSLLAPQTLNLYSYCGNDPINRTDPSGLFWGAIWRSIKSFLNRVFQAAVQAAITAVFTLIQTGNPHLALGAFVGAFVAYLAFPKIGNAMTPGWNPNAKHPLVGLGNSVFNSRYVIKNFSSTSQQWNSSSVFTFAGVFRGTLINALKKIFRQDKCPIIPNTPKDVSISDNIKTMEDIRWAAFAGAESAGERAAALLSVALAFKNLVTHRGKWDYKRIDMKYEDFGNFNYGATGAAAGIGLLTLQSEAGKVQTNPRDAKGNELPKPEAWGIPYEKYPYGDQPEDAIQVEAGYRYYFLRRAGKCN